MKVEDLEKLVDGSPDELIKFAEINNIDLNGLDKDIARTMVKKQYSLTDNQIDAVDFVFWVAYFIERTAEDLIVEPQVSIGVPKNTMDILINKLHFGDKIKVMRELYMSEKDPFIKFMRKIQDMRNDIAHGRFDNLKYGGYDLSDNKGKIKLLFELRSSIENK